MPLPATEKVFSAIQSHYIQPGRLDMQRLRESACSSLEHVPELRATPGENGRDIVVSTDDKSALIHCPEDAPVWMFKACSRRLARAAVELVPDLAPEKLDRLFAESILVGLDPHTRISWIDTPACHFTREGCSEEEIGVGIRFDRVNNRLVVVSVTSNGPAAKAGILPGDSLLSIDGLPASDLSAEEASWLARGTAGSSLLLVLTRQGVQAPFTVHLKRKPLGKPKSYSARTLGAIAFVRIDAFTRGVAKDVRSWIKARRGLRGIILDLRDNPGGLVLEALELADFFLDRGAIVAIESRDGKKKLDIPALHRGSAPRVPMVILVNGGTASASELLAGTLKDNQRALVVGTRTYGKAIIQLPIEIPGGVFLITVQRLLTGAGRSFQGFGIQPHVELRQIVVEPNRLRWRYWPQTFHEIDNQLAIEDKSALQEREDDEPLLFLASAERNGHDREIRIARGLLRGLPWLGASRRHIRSNLERIRRQEQARIHAAFSKSGIQTTLARSPMPAFEVEFPDQSFLAGTKSTVWIQVANKGSETLRGLSCHLETGNPYLADHELGFPAIPPSGTSKRNFSFYLPADAPARQDPVEVVWHGPDGILHRNGQRTKGLVRIQSRTKPRIGMFLSMKEQHRLNLCANIKNFGRTNSPGGFIALDRRSGPAYKWDKTYRRFGELAPGTTSKVCFSGTRNNKGRNESGSVVVRLGDEAGRILGVRSLRVPEADNHEQQGSTPASRRPGFNPSLQVDAERLAIEEEIVNLTIRAWANTGKLADITVFVAGKKVVYRTIDEADITIEIPVPVESEEISPILVLVRNDSRSGATERLLVHRVK